MNRKHSTQLALCLATLLASPLRAADESDWQNVLSLSAGDRIGVIRSDQTRVEGRFQAADASRLQLDSGGGTSIRQDEVFRVYRIGLSRGKRVLIGAVAGLAAGGAVAAGIANRMNGEGFFSGNTAGAGAALALGGGAAIGAAAGGYIGQGYKTIYRRRGGN